MGRYKQAYTLYKRGDYWYYRTYDSRGYRTTGKTTGCTSKGAAKAYCDALLKANSLTQSHSVRLKDYAEHFYDDDSIYVLDRARPLSANALYNMRLNYKAHILPEFGEMYIGDIKLKHLQEYKLRLLSQYKMSTVNLIMTTLKNIFKFAEQNEDITSNPFRFFVLRAPVDNRRDAFTLEQVRQLYWYADREYRPYILLLALTGLRINEAAGLAEEDYLKTEKTNYIRLSRQWNRLLQQYQPLKERTAGASREIPVIPELVNICRAPVRSIQRLVNEWSKENNLALTPHSLRHFFVSSAKAHNVNYIKVEIIAGHKLQGIQDTYTHLSADDLADILSWQKEVYDYITTL